MIGQSDAEEWTQALGQTCAGSWRQIALAKKLGVPKALGLTTEQWVNEKLGGYVRLSVDDRREAVRNLTDEGHSTREVAEVLGVTHDTVARDVRNLTPPEILEAAKVIRAEKQEAKRAEKLALTAQLTQQNSELPITKRKYSAIYADPPWSFEVWSGAGKDRSVENHYPTMAQADIEAMNVADLAADNCAPFLWAVMPQLSEALRVIGAWGFQYKTCAFVWVKQTADESKFATGMGYWTRANAELCLLATRGSPVRLNADVHQVIQAPRSEHSRKPSEIAARIERLVPGPYIELFARNRRPGWDVWGNQSNAAN